MNAPLLLLAVMFGAGGASPCPAVPLGVETATHAYGADRGDESLDLYLPQGLRGEPLAVYVHGGAWVSRDKSEYAQLGKQFARCGIAAAIVNYPLAPASPAALQADKVAQSVHWLKAHSQTGGYDATRVFLIGHSAGAQLALYATAAGLMPPGSIAGIVALGSVGINPSTDVALLAPAYRSIYDAPFGDDRNAWTHFDLKPLLRGKEPPVLVIHGRNDTMAPQAISQMLYDELRAAGDHAQFLQPSDRGHWDMLDAMSAIPGDPTMLAVERFILGK